MFGEDKLWFVLIFDEMFWLPEPASALLLSASGIVLWAIVSISDKYAVSQKRGVPQITQATFFLQCSVCQNVEFLP